MRGRPVVLARARAQAGLLAACAVLLLAGSAAVTGLVLHGSLSATAGARQRLGALPAAQRLLEVTSPSSPSGITAAQLATPEDDPLDAAVADDVRRTLGVADLPAHVHLSGRSDLLPLVGSGAQGPHGPVRLVAVVYRDLPAHADLVAGQWAEGQWTDGAGAARASGASGPLPVTLHADAAAALAMAVGDSREVDLGRGHVVRITLVGTWRPRDATDPFFAGDPLEVGGSDGPTRLGPLVPADPAVLGRVDLRWRVVPDVEALDAADLPRLARALDRLDTAARHDSRLPQPDVADDLRPAVRALAQESFAARSVAAVPAVVVALLLATALLLAARLLVERRAGETQLVRARGASAAQVAGWALQEGVLLALPAAVLATPLAWWAMRLAHPGGSQAAAVPTAAAWGVGVACAVGAALLLVVPSLLAARQWRGTASVAGTARAVEGRRPQAAGRVGLELALLVGAAVAVWQLRRYAASGTGSSAGSGPGLLAGDPVLLVAPALALLAGAVLAARVVPVLARLLARVAARRPGAPLALAAWEVARRPATHAPAVLLLALTVGSGLLAIGYDATYSAAQEQAAAARVGADVQLKLRDPPGPADASTIARAGAYASVPGVIAVTPALLQAARAGSTELTLVAADSTTLAPELAGPLSAGGSAAGPPPGVALPAGTTRLRVEVSARVEVGAIDPVVAAAIAAAGSGEAPAAATVSRRLAGTLWLAAGTGEAVGLPLPELVVDSASPASTAVADLRLPEPGGPQPAGGWRVAGLEVALVGSAGSVPAAVTSSLRVDRVSAASDDGAPVDVGSPSWPQASLTEPGPGAPAANPPIGRALVGGPVRGPVPAVITRDLADTAALATGSTVTVQAGDRALAATVAGVVEALPFASGPAVLVDLGALTARDLATGQEPRTADRWFVALDPSVGADDDRRAAVVDALTRAAADGAPTRVQDRVEVARGLASRLPAAGVGPALLAGAVAALALSAAGLAVAAAAAGRRRRVERAVLRVLGASRSQVRRAAVVESLGVGLLALAAGAAVGLAVCRLTLPGLVATVSAAGSGAAGSGPVTTALDPVGAAAVVAVAAGVLVLVPSVRAAVAGATPARRRPAADVRLGEEL